MDPYQLTRLRDQYSPNDYMQGVLGPMEHKAFVRELRQNDPLAALSMLFAIPAYSAAKGLGILNARSPASWDEVFAAYEGLLGR